MPPRPAHTPALLAYAVEDRCNAAAPQGRKRDGRGREPDELLERGAGPVTTTAQGQMSTSQKEP
jgi:hypothetical protein